MFVLMRYFVAISVLSLLAFPRSVMADEYWKFMAVKCIPEIGFLQIRTFGFYNPFPNSLKRETEQETVKAFTISANCKTRHLHALSRDISPSTRSWSMRGRR